MDPVSSQGSLQERGKKVRGDLTMGAEAGVMWNHKPKAAGVLWLLAKARKHILPYSMQKNTPF